jgi:hypothetical protein
MKAIVYAGPHYGRPHEILSRNGRTLIVQHPEGAPFVVNQCDAEMLREKPIT